MNPQQACKPQDEWFTPPWLLDKAREALGGEIPWDLASCPFANETVRANAFFSQERSFLIHHASEAWREGFWVNPPFSLCKEFVAVMTSGPLRGVALTNANTDAKWWQSLCNSADCTVLLSPRVAFISPATGRKVSGNPKGQSLFLWGVPSTPFEGCGVILQHKETVK